MPRQAAQIKKAQNEVVVGSRYAFERSTQRTDSRDRVETRLDARSLRQLRLDAEIESDVSILADSVFSNGMEIVSAVFDEENSDYQEANEIAEFCDKALSNTQRPLEIVLKEMFKAAFYNGVKVGEIVLKYRNDVEIDGKLVLDRINPKPSSATAFVTDKFYNVLGLVGAKRPGQIVVSSDTIQLSQDEIIPREKFLIFDFEIEDNDPRGLSQVRAAFEAYCDKQLTRAQWKEWRRTSAIPKKFGTTAQGAKSIRVKNSDGTPLIVNGIEQTISAQQGLMNGLEGFSNNSAIAAEFGTAVNQLEVTGTGVQFERHFKSCNSEIRKVILGDSLATGDADKDARAARESSKDVIDMRKQALRISVSSAVERDVLRLITVMNFGADKAHLTPKCFLGDTEANDWAGDLQAASSAGYQFAPKHMGQLDSQFGLEPRDGADEIIDTNLRPAEDEGEETE